MGRHSSIFFFRLEKLHLKIKSIIKIISLKSRENKKSILFFGDILYYCVYFTMCIFGMMAKILLIYLVLINIVTFIIRWVDKRKSVKHKRRISEKQLLIFTAVWWFIGAIAWMTVWHHKTIKWKFLWKFWLIVLARIVILSLIYYFLYW